MKRDTFSIPLDLGSELIVDNFAGGGGASTGLERAFGRPVDIAINHDPEAIAMHTANHPHTRHYCESVFDVDPAEITGNQPVGLVWLSPDCKHFSKAKGGKPVSKKIRGLAWIALRWAATVKPRVIMLENVEEFVTWGPLGADGRPCPKQRGRTFRTFVNALRTRGYTVDWRELRACGYGAPTIRKRLFLVARRDGLPIVWPTPTHGDPNSEAVRSGKLQPWRTAADCIDWSIPCPSIFERARPLKDATLRRIARGIMKFVVNSADPFVIHRTHQGSDRAASIDVPLSTVTGANRGEQALVAAHITKFRANSVGSAADAPLHTVTAGGDCVRPAGAAHAMGLVSATLIQTGYGEREGQEPRVPGLDKPLGTAVAGGVKHAVVAAFLAKHYGGHESPGAALDASMSTVTTQDHHHLVTAQLVGCGGRAGQSRPRDASESTATLTSKADTTVAVSHLVKLRGTCRDGARVDEPLHTISAGGTHHAEVRAFLIKYYGEGGQWQDTRDPMHTIPTKDRIGLVTIHGEDYAIVDIGMRMLTPRELARAQGFPYDAQSQTFVACLRSKSISANAAEKRLSDASTIDQSGPVAVRARIGFGRMDLELLNHAKSLSLVLRAGSSSSSPLPTRIADIARLLAATPACEEQITTTGKAAPRARGKRSTPPESGDPSAMKFGAETAQDVVDAENGINMDQGNTKFTISPDGQNIPHCDSPWKILFSYVDRAIASSIQSETFPDCSFSVEIVVEDGYVLDPVVDGKPLSKSAQVRMIGNSVCPDVATALICANFAHEREMAGVAA